MMVAFVSSCIFLFLNVAELQMCTTGHQDNTDICNG